MYPPLPSKSRYANTIAATTHWHMNLRGTESKMAQTEVAQTLVDNYDGRSPEKHSAGYVRAYTLKCTCSAVAAPVLGMWAMRGDSPASSAVYFGAYFVFDVVYDGAMDLAFRPKRKNLDVIILAHHVVGILAMLTTPASDVCMEAWRYIWVGEFTSPLLYLTLWFRFATAAADAPRPMQLLLLAIWPVLRGAAPLYALYLQLRGDGAAPAGLPCRTHNLLVTLGYLAMNAFFWSRLLARLRRSDKRRRPNKD